MARCTILGTTKGLKILSPCNSVIIILVFYEKPSLQSILRIFIINWVSSKFNDKTTAFDACLKGYGEKTVLQFTHQAVKKHPGREARFR